jgi:pyridoxamine 5'-phosphate oxidase family protein
MSDTPLFTEAEIHYLSTQPLARLATVDTTGVPQNSPVGFFLGPEAGPTTAWIDIAGHALGASRKFRNVQAGGVAALVVDDLVSQQPWQVRGIEIRGTAEALVGQDPPLPYFSGELIRIRPRWIYSWGLDDAPRRWRAAG